MFNFKIAVFDLDRTLWNGKTLYEDVLSILHRMKSYKVFMYIASFHLDAHGCCKELGIDKYFIDIYNNREITKLQMIDEIHKMHPDIQQSEIIFFDDNIKNIEEVASKSLVRAVHVNSFGLNWVNIPTRSILFE